MSGEEEMKDEPMPEENTALRVWGAMTIVSLLPMAYLAAKLMLIAAHRPILLDHPTLGFSPDQVSEALWFVGLAVHWHASKLFFGVRMAPEVLGFEIVPRTWLQTKMNRDRAALPPNRPESKCTKQ